MALRKVSDLENVDLQGLYNSGQTQSFDDIFFEVSYPLDVGIKSYKSMKTTLKDLKNVINDFLVRPPESSGNNTINFEVPVLMGDSLSVLSGFWLSGNFFLNKEFSDEAVRDFKMEVKTGNVSISSMNDIKLLARTSNYLSSRIANYITAPTSIICSDTQILAKFSNGEVFLQNGTGKIRIDQNGNIQVNGRATFNQVINGCALCAKWADLAELYDSDEEYSPGTLVKFGGSQELTIANNEANAVVTTNPGLILGSSNEKQFKTKLGIALVGRVPVKCHGQIEKFDRIVLSKIPGIGCKLNSQDAISDKIIGIALQKSASSETNLVECVVQMNF